VYIMSERQILDSAVNQTAVIILISLLTLNSLKTKINQLLKNSVLTSQKTLHVYDEAEAINAQGNMHFFFLRII
jgi:hypothetical protein